ncbi:hypothetical protein EAF04_007867 [Stromatinia cepivora]|nr:hypothetical protein EAF04_007867 [Stromatinia cepivora]
MGAGASFCAEIYGGSKNTTSRQASSRSFTISGNDRPDVSQVCPIIEMAPMISFGSVGEKFVGRTHCSLKDSIFSVALSAQGYLRLSLNTIPRLRADALSLVFERQTIHPRSSGCIHSPRFNFGVRHITSAIFTPQVGDICGL